MLGGSDQERGGDGLEARSRRSAPHQTTDSVFHVTIGNIRTTTAFVGVVSALLAPQAAQA
jgi:hypothetical protein